MARLLRLTDSLKHIEALIMLGDLDEARKAADQLSPTERRQALTKIKRAETKTEKK